MRISQVITSLDENSGGTASYIQLLNNELIKLTPLDVLTINSPKPLCLDERIVVLSFYRSFPWLKGYSIDFKRYLKETQTNVFHGNGIWDYPIHEMARIAQKRNIPYILSPHGMLEPWALNAGGLKKRLALTTYQLIDLNRATCLHATAQSEAENFRNLGLNNPIAIVPNGIDLAAYPNEPRFLDKEFRTLLFLSRIHPVKGIELLIDAWALMNSNLIANWKVRICGNGEKKYIEQLKKRIFEKGLENTISIEGPCFNEKKFDAYKKADLFVLPTYSENFGIVILEAMASGLPVITTKGAPWKELSDNNAGWWIEIGVEPLIEALTKALTLTREQRNEMGENARKLAWKSYSIESVAHRMNELYTWVAGESSTPSFVKFD